MTDHQRRTATSHPENFVISQLRLKIEPQSVTYARIFVKTVFGAWSLGVSDDAELLVSEVVTNVVKHVGKTYRRMHVVVLRLGNRVRIEVHDPSTRPPEQREAEELDESGHGLFLVETLSADWGCSIIPLAGKMVWFEVYA